MYRISIFLIVLTMAACGQDAESCEAPETQTVATTEDGSSELALMMRDMFTDSWKTRQAILKGKSVSLDAETLARIHSAEATQPEKVASPVFASMADSYLASVKALNAATDSSSQAEVYSRMVQQCEVCHQQFCPGPLAKIKKLRF